MVKRAAHRTLTLVTYGLLGLLALIGFAFSGAYFLVSTDLGRGLLIPRLIRAVDDELAGRVEFDSFRLEPHGGVELQGMRVFDPDGELALSVQQAKLSVDLIRLRSRTVVLRLEVDRPAVLLHEKADGTLSLVQAFAPTRPSTEPSTPWTGDSSWTFRVERLSIRHGSVRYLTASGANELDAREITIDGRGEYGRAGSHLELKLRSQMVVPAVQTAALDFEGRLRHGTLQVSVLRSSFGQSALEAVAEGDLLRQKGRLAILSAKLAGPEVLALIPGKPLSGELEGVVYAESDGRKATAAMDVRPGQSRGGSVHLAAAARLPPEKPAAGFELVVEGFDPSRVISGAPPGSIFVSARGHGSGTALEELKGSLSLSLKPSRLRGGMFGPGELMVSASSGTYEVSRLALALPGGALEGEGRYAARGELGGRLSAEGKDLAELAANLESMLGMKLPRMAGRVQLSAQVDGTMAAPSARLSLSSPSASLGDLTVKTLAVTGEVQGPRAAFQGRFEGGAAAIAIGRRELKKASLRAAVQGRSVELAFDGLLPDLGQEPVAVQGSGELSADRKRLHISALTMAFPGNRFALAKAAEVNLEGPSVDRLELASGDQRLVLEGGIRERSLELTVAIQALALGKLPWRLVSPDLRAEGLLSAQLRATGRMVAKGETSQVRGLVVEARLGVEDGSVRGVKGLSAEGSLRYDGDRQRADLKLGARRVEGGELLVRGELPVDPARARLSSPISLEVALRAFPLPEAMRLAAAEELAISSGTVHFEAALNGTVGAPNLSAKLELAEMTISDIGPMTVGATLEGNASQAKLGTSVDLRGGRLLLVDARLPMDLSGLLRQSRRAVRALDSAPLTATVTVPGYELSRVAGMGPVPEGISGKLAGQGVLSGSRIAPRMRLTVDLADGSYQSYSGLGLHAEAKAGEGGVELNGRGTLRAVELMRLSARAGWPLEKLVAGPIGGAPISAEVFVPETALEQAEPSFPIKGRVSGHWRSSGTLDAPRYELDLRARGLSLPSYPIGDLDAAARYASAHGHAHAELRAARGGELKADFDLSANLGLAALQRGGLGGSPAELKVAAHRLDLSILPAVTPGLIHSVQGTLEADVQARGPISRLRPLGNVKLIAQRVSVVEFGEWTDIQVDASLDEDVVRVAKLEAHRGDGSIEGELEGRGLSRKEGAELKGKLVSRSLTVSRAGQDLATINLEMSLQGKLKGRDIQADVVIPTALVNLPERSPRPLQSLEERRDITIGPPKRKKASDEEGSELAPPMHAVVHLLVPNRFFVRSESPRTEIELKAELDMEMDQDDLLVTGTVSTIRGRVEPIGGRVFNVDRGRVQFSGSEPQDAILDVIATYDNPNAKVQVAVTGPATQPQIRMSSQPALEESQIALLIATGRTELKANSGGVGTLGAEDASRAALGAVATQLFRDLVAAKLPVDSVAVEPGQLRAGKYLSDKIYVGYMRRFDLQQQQQQRGVNQNELRFEYQFSTRWNLELRYGDAGAGSAGVIWQKDY